MEVIIAKTAGFCFGVDKAVNILNELLESNTKHIFTYGPIIHNEHVVEEFETRGVKVINSLDEISSQGCVVIRTHGVVPEVYNEIERRGIRIVDATCPYVKKIHNLVKEKMEEGYQIVIVGDRKHPEVQGINGWCDNKAYIVNNIEDVDSLEESLEKLCVVAQTTLTFEKWETINKYLSNKFKYLIKFDTICSATSQRQNEAAEIAKSVEFMIVIGGENSSNTQTLYEICKKHCSNTMKIEVPGDLLPVDICKYKKIGITAGASTPGWIIEEVLKKMNELNKDENELSFKEAFESSLVTLNTGQVVKGKIIGFNNTEIYVDLGFKSDGTIAVDEYSEDPDFDPNKDVTIGEEIDVFIIRVNDGEGVVQLSRKKVESLKYFDIIEEAYKNKTPVEAKVIDVVNGGVIANAGGVRIFIPASQLSDHYVKDLNEFLRQTVMLRVIEFNKDKRKYVGSCKVLLEEGKSSKSSVIWDKIEVGKKYNGAVKSITDFGAFVDIGGVDGLVHISELSWTKVVHPSDVLTIGDKIDVTVLKIDKEKKRISLGFRKKEDNPWLQLVGKFNIGDIVKGKVVRMVPFGAFVELDDGIDGLVHLSQISHSRIVKPSDVLEIGQEVEVKITDINLESNKISLSIKEVNPIIEIVAEASEEITITIEAVEKEVPATKIIEEEIYAADTIQELIPIFDAKGPAISMIVSVEAEVPESEEIKKAVPKEKVIKKEEPVQEVATKQAPVTKTVEEEGHATDAIQELVPTSDAKGPTISAIAAVKEVPESEEIKKEMPEGDSL